MPVDPQIAEDFRVARVAVVEALGDSVRRTGAATEALAEMRHAHEVLEIAMSSLSATFALLVDEVNRHG